MFNSKKRVKDMAAPGTSAPTPSAGNAEKLEIAKRLALRINAQKNLGAEAQVLVPFHFKVRLFTEHLLLLLLLLLSLPLFNSLSRGCHFI